jgi:peptidyl-tRNA hydrolase
VLGGFRPEEQTEIQIAVQRAADAIILALRSGLGAAMNLFNQKPNANPPPQTPR